MTIDVRTLKEVGRRVFAGIFPSWVAVWRALRNDSLVCFHSEVPVSPVSCSSGDWKVKCGVNASQLSAVFLQLALMGQCRHEARTCCTSTEMSWTPTCSMTANVLLLSQAEQAVA